MEPAVGVASDEGSTPLTNDAVPTGAEVAALKISDLRADQDKGGQPTIISFSTDRPASVIIEIGPTNKLGGGFVYGPMADYPYPFTRNLHSITYTFPPGTWYYRVAVYDEQGTGTSDDQIVHRQLARDSFLTPGPSPSLADRGWQVAAAMERGGEWS